MWYLLSIYISYLFLLYTDSCSSHNEMLSTESLHFSCVSAHLLGCSFNWSWVQLISHKMITYLGMTSVCLCADILLVSCTVTFLQGCFFFVLIYPAVNTHPSVSMRATHILMDIFAPFLLSHATTLNLISLHKQLMVDTVQIVSLSLQPHFIFFIFSFSTKLVFTSRVPKWIFEKSTDTLTAGE